MAYAKVMHSGITLAGAADIGRDIWNFATVCTPVPLVFGCAFVAFAFWRQGRRNKHKECDNADIVENCSHGTAQTAVQLLPRFTYRIYCTLTAQATQVKNDCCSSPTSSRKPKEIGAAATLDFVDDTVAELQVSCKKKEIQLSSPQQQQQKPHENMQDTCEPSADPGESGAVQSTPSSLAPTSDNTSSSKPSDNRETTNPNMDSSTDYHRGAEFARISEDDPIVDPACMRNYCPAPIGWRRGNFVGSGLRTNELIVWPSPLLARQGLCNGTPPSPAPTMTAMHSPPSSPCSDGSGFSLFTSNKFC
ncbi:hypothetical protein H4R24_003638 [Coemansia sp. RSA 988]|nr:hypothetical protein H4R24_003638 [Coemansia sp. RSA 988]